MAPPTTRKDLITIKYNEFQEAMKSYVDVSIFPPLEDIDMSDLIYFFATNFEKEGDNRQTLKYLMGLREVSLPEDDFEKLYPVVQEFIVWLKTLP